MDELPTVERAKCVVLAAARPDDEGKALFRNDGQPFDLN